MQILSKRFVACEGNWKLSSFIQQEIESIRKKVGTNRVICGLSGGVDSSVVAALLYEAIGSQLSCIFVDNGLLREGERAQVEEQFSNHFKTDLHVVDARDLFLSGLAGVTDPQKKRKIIGKLFIDVFREEAVSIPNAHFLAQGTLYPDVIESGANPDGPAATIKSHHNVGGLPEELGFELIEPLRDLFKDEVRKIGLELGLPEELIWRHPFPGPGLAVRCLGEIREERLVVLRKADTIFIEELIEAGLYREIQQAFVVLLPIQTVGVMGDDRTYEDVLALRAVTTDDFMTADWYPPFTRPPSKNLHANYKFGSWRKQSGLRHQFKTTQHHRMGIVIVLREAGGSLKATHLFLFDNFTPIERGLAEVHFSSNRCQKSHVRLLKLWTCSLAPSE